MNRLFGELSFGYLIGINSIVILAFMLITSFVCPEGLSGGECVKSLDNKIFFIQVVVYLFMSIVYLVKFDNRKWLKLLVGLIVITLIYVLAATMHSISKAGLF